MKVYLTGKTNDFNYSSINIVTEVVKEFDNENDTKDYINKHPEMFDIQISEGYYVKPKYQYV